MDEIFKQYGGTIITVIAVVGLIGCISFVDESIALNLSDKLEKEFSKKIVTDIKSDALESKTEMTDLNKIREIIEQTKINGRDEYSLTGVDSVVKFKSMPDDTWTDIGKVKGNVYAKVENNRLKLSSSNGKISFTNLSNIFFKCNNLTDISGLAYWDVSDATKMNGMFYGCNNLTDISPLKNWDVSNVETMCYMFEKCISLSDISCLANWNMANVEYTRDMFRKCIFLTDITPLKGWDVSKILSIKKNEHSHIRGMFYNTSLNLNSEDLLKEKFGDEYKESFKGN